MADALSRIDIEDLKNQYDHEILAITRSMSKNEKINITKDDLQTDEIIEPRVYEPIHAGEILNRYHNDKLFGCHCGQKRPYAKIRSEFYWPNMTRDVAKFVNNCHTN